MVNLINSAVMTGLMNAASHAEMSRFCTGVAIKGDEGTYANAMGYAGEFREKAMTAAEQVGEALIERAREARADQRHEQAQRVEVRRAENRTGAEPVEEAGTAEGPAAEETVQPAVIVDLSQGYMDAVQSGGPGLRASAAAPVMAAGAPAGRHEFSVNISV